MLIIMIFAIYTLSFLIRNSSGPFNLFGLIRNKLVSNKYLGVFFYQLLTCPWCIGFHCGYIIYILQFTYFKTSDFFMWALAGSAIVALGDKLYETNHNLN